MRSLWITGILSLATIGVLGFAVFEWQKAWKSMEPELAEFTAPAEAPAKVAAHGTAENSHGTPGAAPETAKKADGHGEGSAESAKAGDSTKPPGDTTSLLTMGEMVISLGQTKKSRVIAMKLELELFSEEYRQGLDQREPVIKNAILDYARAQDATHLESLPGKLLFKEGLVARINEALGLAAIRQIHFQSFTLE